MTTYSLFVLMYLSFEDQKKITSFFMDKYQVSPDSIERGMHITIYHSRRPIYSLNKSQSIVSIDVDVKETRFMVLAPGGENPKPNLIPSKRSIGIRLTKRNIAIPDILKIRREAFKNETSFLNRKNTTDWQNAFGARNFQPHIKLLRPGNKLPYNLKDVGNDFRETFNKLNFTKIIVKEY